MIKDDKTREEMKRIIRENQDKTLNELKRMIKNKLPEGEREKFTFDDLKELISEINQERKKEEEKRMQKVSFRRTNSTRNKEGEER